MHKDIEQAWHNLESACRENLNETEQAQVRRAFDYAYDILEERKWTTGETIIIHSLEVALVVAEEVSLGVDSITAGLLHNVPYEDVPKKPGFKEIEDNFGPVVRGILEGMAKINALGTDTVGLHSENYRKLMLALAGDVRVILVKIADRLHVMRHLDNYPAAFQSKISVETSHLYAPLAHRLGLYYVNSELLDLCLKYLTPDAYNHVSECLTESETERKNFIAAFVKPIEEKLKSKGFKFEMKARTKAINSIWNKMKKQGVPFDEVYDIFAIRVILDSDPKAEKSDCWQVYSIVTEEYQANPERMRDWITVPKSNGYESLHATVLGPQKKWVEIQIRTKRMDEIAEKGLAAHWKYKGGSASAEMEKWLASVREILENPELNVVDFIDEFNTNIYTDEIFVFTPKGDLKRLPAGATLLDFAYEIHSVVGDHCVGGMVDGKKVTLRYKVKNGEQISIDTSNNQKPKLDWLDIAITSKAKNRIKASLNEERKREAENGKEILTRKLKNWKIEYNDELIRTLLKHYQLKLAQDLYYNISVEKIDTLDIKEVITAKDDNQSAKSKLEESLPVEQYNDMEFTGGDDYLVIDNNIKDVTHKLAQCCNPIFGDDIFGFVTIKEGIKIHRSSCPNARQMFERYPYRIIPAKWRDSNKKSSFQATIKLSGTDDVGIVAQISHVISKDIGVSMRSINIDSTNGEFEGTLRVYVNNIEHLEFLMRKLQHIKGIVHVSRADG
ncbi:RelA/SpoT family protein [Mangrovibacterium diazotrophicum]|uniref:GTP pyrophosphokinase n=1 Tax=Mangrovibacterium diazotrophicum TaxID=1261403 RepID=A0A419W352_9BACT|nr:RelA/SpoT family protein [Mangrovibacterium diazotrophicum]RKD89902.1 GTP pyrophosphokinase [Mangrovibacterium diazotrophicum]